MGWRRSAFVLRRILLHQELRSEDGDGHQRKNKQQIALHAGFVLRAAIFRHGSLCVAPALCTTGRVGAGALARPAERRSARISVGTEANRPCMSCTKRHRIVASANKGMATKQTPNAHRRSAYHAVALNCFSGVFGTSRGVTAGGRKHRRDRVLIAAKQK